MRIAAPKAGNLFLTQEDAIWFSTSMPTMKLSLGKSMTDKKSKIKGQIKYLTTSKLSESQLSQVCRLWNKEYPIDVHHKRKEDLEQYLSGLAKPNHTIIEDGDGKVKAWFFDFMRNKERWFGMIVDSTHQGKGYGRELIKRAKNNYSELNGWIINSKEYLKENGGKYEPPTEFYRKMGFDISPDQKFDSKVLKTIKIKWRKNMATTMATSNGG